MSVSSRPGDGSADLAAELDQVMGALRGRLSVESVPRVGGLLERFGLFLARGFDVTTLRHVSSTHVDAFVKAASAGRGLPSVATMLLRRSVLRSAFRVARELGLVDHDPTIDVWLPSRTRETARPLTDLEVQRCRRAALEDLASTRLSVPWALGEATARTAEIPHITVGDVHLADGRVWIHGSSNTEPRWGELTSWGRAQLARHVRDLPIDRPEGHLTRSETENMESRRAHSSQAIRETMRRAGLTVDSSLRPASLTAWAGQRVLRESGRIEVAASALGMRSLDGAARLIGWDWARAQSSRHE